MGHMRGFDSHHTTVVAKLVSLLHSVYAYSSPGHDFLCTRVVSHLQRLSQVAGKDEDYSSGVS